MSLSANLRARFIRAFAAISLVFISTVCPAASIRGLVTDSTGAKVAGANVVLVSNGKVARSTVSGADGSFQILTGSPGRFFLLVSARSFRQLETPGFYAGQLDAIERNVVLEPEWVREAIVVTATGTPTPQPQTSATTSVLAPVDLALREDLVSALRLMPGTFVAQNGQFGAQTSMFVRGGDSDANKILLDGVSVGDMGGQFDFGPFSTTAVERAEIYRGPDSSLYGADAASGVVSLTTQHGTTSFPSLLLQADAGNFSTSREEAELAGAHNKLDYLGAFSWLQSANNLPMDEYHLATSAANLGWQLNGSTQLRATLHYGVDATGVPNQWDFYRISDDRKEGDQDLYGGGALENQTTPVFHNRVQFGLTRKREQSQQWYPAGICIPADSCVVAPVTGYPGNYYGQPTNIQGANGYKAQGPALLNYSTLNYSKYPNRLDLISNRDQINYQGDYHLTPHLLLLAGFQYENERAAEREPVYFIDEQVNRTNYDYLLGAHGDFAGRFFYTLGAAIEHYQLIGNGVSPHAGLSFYAVRPRNGIFSGTRLNVSFSQGVREPKLTDEFGSLYHFLEEHGGQATIQQLNISPIKAPTSRTWEGGGEQAFWRERIIFRVSYFHNEFGHDIEGVGAGLVPQLLPNLTPAQQNELEGFLNSQQAYTLDLNSLTFRAQGIESTIESGIGKNIFFRGGYTYLDSVVQRSFSSDNEELLGNSPQTFANTGIPVGIYSPLKGARPFRRPPHTGFFTATYTGHKITAVFTSAFASRSDDSTFLGYMDLNQGNSLVLPNRNLDFGYAKIDLGASYKLLSWLSIYSQQENLTNNTHIAPIGYPSLPFNLRTGLRVELGKSRSR